MRTKLTRIMAAAAVLGTAAVGLITSEANALPAGTAPNPGLTMSPTASSPASTPITLSLAAGNNACPGDSATNGYFWSTYLVPASYDPATLQYQAGSPVGAGTDFVQPLFSAGGTPIVNQTTAATTGILTPIPTFSIGVFGTAIPAGAYKLGFACIKADAANPGFQTTERFWQTSLTVTNTGTAVSFVYGAIPGAPTLAAGLTPGDGTLSGSFTAPAADPAATGYTVSATPTGGGTAITLSLTAAGAFTISGLTNGVAYNVTVTQANPTGTSQPSNAVTGTPNPGPRPAVTGLTCSYPSAGAFTVSWNAPSGVAPTDYLVDIPSLAIAGALTGGALSYGPAAGTAGTASQVTVTPVHPAPYVGTPASITCTPLAAQVIIQDITVSRPQGYLTLTQRCGVNGALSALAAGAIPGFEAGLPAIAPSADQVGTAPVLSDGVTPDPQFGQYPNPAGGGSYPTRCGIDLGTATLITSGPLAGQYYAADGFINEITVSNSDDANAAWNVVGTMSTFTGSASGDTFSGNNLGWQPALQSATPGLAATSTATVAPLTTPGLGSGVVLGSAPAGASLGIAEFDARLLLLVPATVRTDTYTGTLTFTII